MSGTPPFLRTAIVVFLARQNCITQRTEKAYCLDVFYKTKQEGKFTLSFLGTLDFSNPSNFYLRMHESEDTTKSIDVAKKIAGGMEKSVSLA